jgi:hypothetical protein
MGNPAQDATNQSKQAALKAVKSLLNEPSEILKTAAKQIALEPESSDKNNNSNQSDSFLGIQENGFSEEEKRKQQQVDMSRLRELEAELRQVRIENIVRELQEKIMNGEPVYLEEYAELPIEQKQVLKAQMEAVAQRRQAEAQAQASKAAFEPSSRPSRRLFGFGTSKKHAEDLQKSTETRMPPSG